MSGQYRDAMDDLREAALRDHIASELSIDPETLDDYPYEIDYQTSGDIVTGLLIQWDDEAPEGVTVYGDKPHQWSKASPLYDEEQPDEE